MLGAVLLIVGDELLAGELSDSNGPFLADQLTAHGFHVHAIHILPDDAEAISEAVHTALDTCHLIVVSGGLGPTSDDRTTEGVALALGRTPVLHQEQWERIRQLFLTFRGQEPPPGNEKQATIPSDAEILHNPVGTAPGYVTRTGTCAIAVLPGPPKENRPMFDIALLPWLDRNWPKRSGMMTRIFRVFGLPESEIGHRLHPLEQKYQRIRVSYQFRFPEILAKLRCPSESLDILEAATCELKGLLDPHIYGTGDETLPTVLGRTLCSLGLRIVTAESCTGGLAAKLLTDTPGSSSWMDGGFVTYNNTAKEKVLGVPARFLQGYGAVSEPVALAMLKGAFERSTADVGFAVTGIAGPDGGTVEKPVGTVCIAWGRRDRLHVHTYRFAWDREYNRLVSAWAAMHRLYMELREDTA